jgi:hypothetical protein
LDLPRIGRIRVKKEVKILSLKVLYKIGPKFGRRFVRPLHFLFGPFKLIGPNNRPIGNTVSRQTLKGQCHEIFCFWFFHESVSPQPKSIPLGPFPRKFAEIFASHGAITGIPVSTTQVANFSTSFASVVDTFGKFATGVNNTGGKFAIGINDAGDKLPPVSTTDY